MYFRIVAQYTMLIVVIAALIWCWCKGGCDDGWGGRGGGGGGGGGGKYHYHRHSWLGSSSSSSSRSTTRRSTAYARTSRRWATIKTVHKNHDNCDCWRQNIQITFSLKEQNTILITNRRNFQKWRKSVHKIIKNKKFDLRN